MRVLIALVVVLTIIVMSVSTVDSLFECTGERYLLDGSPVSTTLSMNVRKYPWLVRLWRKSDGLVWMETWLGFLFFESVSISDNSITTKDHAEKPVVGYFSTLSKELIISKSWDSRLFKGTCRMIDGAMESQPQNKQQVQELEAQILTLQTQLTECLHPKSTEFTKGWKPIENEPEEPEITVERPKFKKLPK